MAEGGARKPPRPGPAGPRAPRPAGEAASERQRTIDTLCEAFANDELEVEEFERRVAAAHRAHGADELRALLAGLPSSRPPVRAEPRSPAPAPEPEDLRPPAPHAGEVPEWGFSIGVMGAASRTGYWTPGRRNLAFALMGGCEMDFREVALPPGVTEVHAVALMGGVEIIVPPWLRVETSGIGLMGGFEHHQTAKSTAPPGAPVLRISGLALMGGVEVMVRYPGESARDARRRLRGERKAKRLARGGRRDDDEDDDD